MKESIYLPALRGVFGDWVYYSCLMTVNELSSRVSYATQIHKSKKLSEYIQRSLKESRQRKIADYLASQDQRFFNALVVAVYGGSPKWYEASDLKAETSKVDVEEIPEDTRCSIGFLRFEGKEKLFALDGQHRLSGIKLAIEEETIPIEDELPVIFVAHRKNKAGMKRTRRLFVTLNKTAVAVPKRDIIALDEDDVPAICVRWLVEQHPYFSGERIAFNETSNLSVDDRRSFTSIVALYDSLLAIFLHHPRKKKRDDLRFERPEPKVLDEYHKLAIQVFEQMTKTFQPLDRYMKAKHPHDVAKKLRGPMGGHILFRPAGLLIYSKLLAELMRLVSLEEALKDLAKLPQYLKYKPYLNVLWNASKKSMISDGKGLTKRLLSYMLGNKKRIKKLKSDYAKSLDISTDKAVLPEPVSDILSRKSG